MMNGNSSSGSPPLLRKAAPFVLLAALGTVLALLVFMPQVEEMRRLSHKLTVTITERNHLKNQTLELLAERERLQVANALLIAEDAALKAKQAETEQENDRLEAEALAAITERDKLKASHSDLQAQLTVAARTAAGPSCEIPVDENWWKNAGCECTKSSEDWPLPAPYIEKDNKYCQANPAVCRDANTERRMYRERRERLKATKFEKTDCQFPLKIWMDSEIYNWWPTMANSKPRLMENCGVTCQIVDNVHEADVLVFLVNRGNVGGFDPRKHKVALISLESFHGYQLKRPITEQDMQSADFIVSYNAHSDIWVNYMYAWMGAPPKVEKWPYRNPDWEKHKNDSNTLSAWFQGNCVEERREYIKELMKHIKIDSYGQCLHTEGLEVSRDGWHKFNKSKEYKFHLAFENQPLDGYISEKFYPMMYWKTVLIHWGAADIDRWAPGDNSFICANDFANPVELANYIKKVDSNWTLYDSYHEWRNKPLRKRFLRTQAYNSDALHDNPDNWRCRICELFARRYCKGVKMRRAADRCDCNY